jgi:hypothetical protein
LTPASDELVCVDLLEALQRRRFGTERLVQTLTTGTPAAAKDMIDQMCGGLRHAAGVARRAQPAPPARDDPPAAGARGLAERAELDDGAALNHVSNRRISRSGSLSSFSSNAFSNPVREAAMPSAVEDFRKR